MISLINHDATIPGLGRSEVVIIWPDWFWAYSVWQSQSSTPISSTEAAMTRKSKLFLGDRWWFAMGCLISPIQVMDDHDFSIETMNLG